MKVMHKQSHKSQYTFTYILSIFVRSICFKAVCIKESINVIKWRLFSHLLEYLLIHNLLRDIHVQSMQLQSLNTIGVKRRVFISSLMISIEGKRRVFFFMNNHGDWRQLVESFYHRIEGDIILYVYHTVILYNLFGKVN